MAAVADPLELRLLYSPHRPEPPQHAFIMLGELEVLEALYGGAAGGGKSDTLLMDALRYVDVPGYSALLLRKTYADLNLPGALMDRAKAWLVGKSGVKWSGVDFRFTFSSGATLTFGYLQTSNDRYRYQGAEFQFIGFDEVTQFEEADYRYLFSRLRRPSLIDEETGEELELEPEERAKRERLTVVPLRMRTASNPGGRGHEWVLRRFIEKRPDPDDPDDTPEKCAARVFIPAKLDDNPHIDQAGYRASLAALPPVERQRLEHGDWYADDGTKTFPGDAIDAALALGAEFDELARRYLEAGGKGDEYAPPPVDGLLDLGVDWGEHTHGLVIWPLEGGGLWVVAGEEYVGLEPGASTDKLLGLVELAPPWPGRPRVNDAARLLGAAHYDAAGVQSMRTFSKLARTRNRRLRTVAIPFGNYKRETVGYLKHLFERARQGERTRIIAISGENAPELVRQLRGLTKDPRDPELWLKGDDHGPDALVAGTAPIARRWRDRGITQQQRASAAAVRAGKAPPPAPDRRNRP